MSDQVSVVGLNSELSQQLGKYEGGVFLLEEGKVSWNGFENQRSLMRHSLSPPIPPCLPDTTGVLFSLPLLQNQCVLFNHYNFTFLKSFPALNQTFHQEELYARGIKVFS